MEAEDKDIIEFIERYGVVAAPKEIENIRFLLKQEIVIYQKSGGDKDAGLLRLCCFSLFAEGSLDDLELIWEAKMLSQDTSSIIDIEFLCGAGIEQTKKFLETNAGEWAKPALEFILASERCGEFEDFSPQSYLNDSLEYYDDYCL